MRPVHPRRLLAIAVVSAALTLGSTAAATEGLWRAGLDGGWGAVSWNGATVGGYGGGAHLTYGLSDEFNAMFEASATSHGVTAGRSRLLVASSAVGAAYTLDVIDWVPYFGLLVGAYRFSGAELAKGEVKLGFQAALGLDYRMSRSWGLGAQLRYHTFSDEPFSSHYMTACARAEYIWGW